MNIFFVKKHSDLKFERHGDLYDLQFFGVDKVFVSSNDSVFDYNESTDHTIYYKKGDIFRVKLGFSMLLLYGKKALVYSRSGTRKNFKVILTNAVGNIDNNYNGTDDEWMAEFYAIGDGVMKIGQRILQFEIVDAQPFWNFKETDRLEDDSRGGYGQSGI